VGRFDVTFDEWDACVTNGDCDSRISDSGFGRGQQPVINVTFDDAQRYVAWLNKTTGKTEKGEGYRLVTEAEWEYAARAGTTTAYSFGDDAIVLGEYAWFFLNSAARSHPVGEKKPNAFGLYDMHGIVDQWVQDCFHDTYYGAPMDGAAWVNEGCTARVGRGGHWANWQQHLRSATRQWLPPSDRYSGLGFRVGRSLAR
jgi:formylglycine-generating enzyme required for sulfatase activity